MPPKSKKTPFAVKPDDDEENVQATLIVKDGDKTFRLRTNEFGPGDTMACRQQTGLPVEHYFQNIGLDSILVTIWLARRKSGEPNLMFQKVMAKYSTSEEIEALDFSIEYDDDKTEDEKKAEKEADPLVEPA